jgi:predicted MPP superfamily phosphohydrolase
VTRADLLRKRQHIEQGKLKTWSRYGQRQHHQNHLVRDRVLWHGLKLFGLYARGEANVRHPVVRRVEFFFDNLPEAFDGFTILHLSDLHIDGLPDLANNLRKRLQALDVDLCVLTGDYRFRTHGPCHQVYAQMAHLLTGIHAPSGVFGVLGNHDCFDMVAAFKHMGLHILVNESWELRRDDQMIWLAGVDDPHYFGCADVALAFADVPQNAFKLLLVHTPEMYAEAAQARADLYLCGHTHGGQICLPWIGPIETHATCPRRYVRGRWQHGPVQGYTNVGCSASGVPVRFFCPPEIGLLTLHRTAAPMTGVMSEQRRYMLPLA